MRTIELVFSGMAEGTAIVVLQRLKKGLGRPGEIEDMLRRGWLLEQPGASVCGDLGDLDLGRLKLDGVALRVLRYEGERFDLELSFSLDAVEPRFRPLLATKLREYATNLVDGLDGVEVYAGLEPAEDVETRIFTGNELGPLSLRPPAVPE